VQKVYRMQGINTDDKHLEIIVGKMLSRMKITNPGSTDFVTDELVTWKKFDSVNEQTPGKKANAAPVLMGLTRASLEAESWLSAASFQNTKDILSNTAFRKKIDFLRGPKENIIIGAPIPMGTGHPSKARPDWNRKKVTKKEKERLDALEKLKELFR
jgi:DNA-directed RNA polymerase subunit beta'